MLSPQYECFISKNVRVLSHACPYSTWWAILPCSPYSTDTKMGGKVTLQDSEIGPNRTPETAAKCPLRRAALTETAEFSEWKEASPPEKG